VLAIFVVLILIAAGLLIYRLASADRPEDRPRRRADQGAPATPVEEEQTFTLRNVLGENWEDAKNVLQEDGLVVVRENSEDSDQPPETVVGMSPEPGDQVAEGDTVTLFVSTGPPEETDDGEDEEDVLDDIEDEFTPPGQAKKEEKDDD
jgi:serine/threonine-protein kinase